MTTAAGSASRQHAVVLGASLGGLLAARALSSYFAHVTLVEKDAVGHQPESRKGQPQTRHVHGLLGSGRQVMERLPDLAQALKRGALANDFAETMIWYCYGGYVRAPDRF
jgi:glycine/D-amino acid oxidase-like deaminating enzyme